MADNIRVVLAGCGSISGVWLENVADIRDVEIVGLVDINEAAANERKKTFQLDNAAIGTKLAPMLEETEPNVVFDCTVPETHVDVAVTALEHGCHVLGEKPLADTMENAKKICAAAKDARRIHAVLQNRRYDPNIRALRKYLGSGKMGDLTTLDCDFYIGAHFGGFRDHMKHVLLIDMAIHTFDAARFIADADPVSVYCHEWNPKGSWYDHDASAVAVFEMSNGIVYTYRGSWCSEGLNTTWECDWRAISEKGSITWDGSENFKAQRVAGAGSFFSEWEDVHIKPVKMRGKVGHAGVIEEFLRCVRSPTPKKPLTACSDNIKSLAMVFGAVESAETGKKVKIKI